MQLPTAQRYAEHLAAWLLPYCHRIQIAGSVRRCRRECADIDLVAIPKITQHTDLLGEVTGRDNHCLQFLQDYVRDRNPIASPARTPRFLSGGELEGKQVMIQLPKCQLDLFFADDTTFATRLLCRTGSKEHNIWLAQRAIDHGFHWAPYEGLVPISAAAPLPAANESDLYRTLGMACIDPECRELPWLKKHIDSGL